MGAVHQNISAVLKGLGEAWNPGYKPAFNFQMTLVDAVARWLTLNPAWLGRQPGLQHAAGLREVAQIWIGPPPTLSNQPPPQELEQMLHIARKFDVAGRDERNRALGRAGDAQKTHVDQSDLPPAIPPGESIHMVQLSVTPDYRCSCVCRNDAGL